MSQHFLPKFKPTSDECGNPATQQPTANHQPKTNTEWSFLDPSELLRRQSVEMCATGSHTTAQATQAGTADVSTSGMATVMHGSHSLIMPWWEPPRTLVVPEYSLPTPGDSEVERVAVQLPLELANIYRALGKEGYKQFVLSFYIPPEAVVAPVDPPSMVTTASTSSCV